MITLAAEAVGRHGKIGWQRMARFIFSILARRIAGILLTPAGRLR